MKRISEIPYNVIWSFIYGLISKGFVCHKDYEKLIEFKGIHTGKIGFLMGNGPSVVMQDLEKISRMDNIVTFAANRIHLVYDQSEYRPDYVISSDEQVIKDFGQEIINANKGYKVFFASFFKNTTLMGDYVWIKLKNGRPFKFSEKIQKKVMSGGGSLNVALQIGYYMGIREFYLYGVDHDFNFEKSDKNSEYEAKGDDNHFIKNYRSGRAWQAPRSELIEETFIKLDKKLRTEGGKLINSTHGGKLEVLKRIPLNEVFEMYNYTIDNK